MNHSGLAKDLQCYGPDTFLAHCRFTPNGSNNPTITEAQGITSVVRTGAGAWTITFARIPKNITVLECREIENDTTTYHFVRVESSNLAAGTVAISHKSVAFASVAAGPTASDVVDEICCAFLLRVAG